ncbi:telomere length regulation protein TEL2 homolog isoform X1 [Drosophila virilis]|uniref:Uncharacterized protein, isoform B n=1 Tax=Drosophila virilis TaxID=7244 RepID=A0A0Q9WGP5_DROVI|nr:telomere length regulation protein TEL2 homolog isoform X1 [Drosophila virilis]KRF83555.1 uncharacterized protein Dvir_GJ24417, isoform B [Drosophila virilis]
MVDKFISMWKVRELADKVTNVVMNYTEIEGKVREATNDDPWGPTGPLMQELAHATFSYETFPEVMSMLWKRMLQDNKTNWRRTYKSLLLLNYLVRNGSERVVTSSREHIYDLRSLENYTFTDEGGKDQGINVRHKVRELIDFIQDDDRLRDERKKAKKNKDKYIGMSSDAMGSRSGGYSGYSGGSSSSYNDGDWRNNRGDNWYSDKSSADRYEDEDTQYDGEREGSDSDSPSPRRNYRYNDRASPAEVATESKPTNLNMNIRSKAVSSPVSKQPTSTGASKQPPTQKKINLGAAANFGKTPNAAGIHSPTHRDTPTTNSVDLMGSTSPNNNNNNKSNTPSNNNDLLDDLFKTCASTPPQQQPQGEKTLNSAAVIVDDDDDFNPRAADAAATQEFGDFAAAFGSGLSPPSTGILPTAGNDEFADFDAFQSSSTATASSTSALDGNLLTTATPANDAFDLFNAATPAAAPTAATTATDLLAGLGDLSIHQSMPMAVEMQQVAKAPLPPPSELIRLALSKAIADLRDLPSVQSAADASFVAATLRQLHNAGALPGYTTPEQLVGLDRGVVDWSQLASSEYAALIAQLGRLFTQDWPQPTEDVDVLNMFKLDHSIGYAEVAFEMLQQQLARVPGTAASMLAALLQDECLLAICLLHAARQRGALLKRFARTIKVLPERLLEEHDAQTIHFIQLLIGLPGLVANKMGRNLPALFAPIAYGRLLLQQWLKALHFVLQCEDQSGYFDPGPFTWLLTRVVNNFFDASSLESLLRVLEDLAVVPKSRNVLQQIICDLEPSVCFKLAKSALNAQLNLYVLLGPGAMETEHWQHCLLQKLPLQRTPTENGPLCTLLGYLNVTAPTQLHLLFTQLLGIWSKRITLQKLSTQEHLAICKLLILAGKCNGNMKLDHKRQLHDGLGHHLQSPDVVQRYVGMKTVELLYNHMIHAQASEEERLKFDYAALEQTPHWHIIEELEKLAQFKYPSKAQLDVRPSQELLQRLELHMAQFMGEQEQQSHTPVVQSKEQTETVVNMQLDLDSDDDETPTQPLDEDDDDLRPYDMSNDISNSLEQRPKFLLDLLHLLRTKVPNYQIFEGALGTAEHLIRSQLAQQDVRLALELLELFIVLDMQYYFEDFERTQFRCCVAICVARPGACAELLCREFHTENTRYAANVRILILQVLAAAAKELAGDEYKPPTSEQMLDIVPSVAKQPRKFQLHSDEDAAAARLAAAQRIIRERLRAKTRRYLSNKAEPEKQAKLNPFHAVAGTFFFGLVRGQRTRQMLYVKYENILHDIDTQLLINMLHTLAVLVMCSQNCPLLPAMTREIFDLCAFVRFSSEASVRAATLQLLGIALVTTPAHLLVAHFAESLNELKRWLEEFVRSPLVGGESSDECRELAEQILNTCYKLFDSAVLEQGQEY